MSVVIIDIHGNVSTDTIHSYKSYGTLQHSWKTLKHEIHLYAKKRGKAGNENKYEFPPPVDTLLFFGKCLLVNPSGDLTVEMWNDFYDSVMQFESIGRDDSEDEDDDHPDGEYTNGYLKDGFVTSDNELEEEPYKIDLNKKPES